MKKLFKYAAIAALTVGVFLLMHEAATAERGFNAIGGEVAALFIPFFLWIATSGRESGGVNDNAEN